MLGQLRSGSKAPSTRLDSLGCVGYLRGVNRLIAYLRENVMLDFQGDLSVERVRELLSGDDSRDARNLLAKVVSEGKVEDMLLVLTDVLLEVVQTALSDEVMREQLRMYMDS
jgi:hypothetical protein